MRRTPAVLAAVIVAFGTVAAVERTLTPEEEAAIATYFTQRNAAYAARNLDAEVNRQNRRKPYNLCRQYEKPTKMTNYPWHPGLGSQRYTSRPKFPGWDDAANYTWYPDGPNYQRQLKCKKCGGWCNPSGSDCERRHPLPLIDQWRFTARLIATDHKKPMEAKAHVWNAHEHDEITDAQYDELMGIIDTIEAEAEAKTKDPAKTPWREAVYNVHLGVICFEEARHETHTRRTRRRHRRIRDRRRHRTRPHAGRGSRDYDVHSGARKRRTAKV